MCAGKWRGKYQRGILTGGTLKRMIKKQGTQPRFPGKLACMVNIHTRHRPYAAWPKLKTAPREAAKLNKKKQPSGTMGKNSHNQPQRGVTPDDQVCQTALPRGIEFNQPKCARPTPLPHSTFPPHPQKAGGTKQPSPAALSTKVAKTGLPSNHMVWWYGSATAAKHAC